MVKGIVQPVFDETDVHAVRAFQQGIANQAQQLRAWQFIITQCCRVQTEPYYESKMVGGDRDDAIYAAGRRGAGIFILAMLNPEALAEGKELSEKRRTADPTETPPAPRRRFTKRQ